MPELFKANIFELDPGEGGQRFVPPEEVLRNTSARNIQERLFTVNNVPRRLEDYRDNDPLHFANFATLKFPGPGRASGRQATRRIGLNADERFAYDTAMLWDADRHLAFIETGRPGMGAGAVAGYLDRFRGHGADYVFVPSLDREARERALRQRLDRKLKTRVAIGVDDRIDDVGGLGPISALGRELDARVIDVEFSVGPERRRCLNHGVLRNLLPDWFRRADEGQITKLILSGRNHEDDPLEIIDLLQHRESRERYLDVDHGERRIPYQVRWDALGDMHREFIHARGI